MRLPPSGEQVEIRHGEQRAVLVEVGGGIRAYTHGDREVLDPYAEQDICDGAHGTPLIPWPNRLADGVYTFDGTTYQVPITEVPKNNAIHGLLRWHPWRCAERAADRVTMRARIHPFPGYPFPVDVGVEYRLAGDGLTVTTTATNLGDRACPYACGQHPYLSPGAGLVDEAILELDAATWIDTDNPRQLPAGVAPVAGSDWDFRKGERIGERKLDYPFTDLARDSDGRAVARLTGVDGRTVELWVDETYPILEIFTGDTLAPHRARRGLGCEPMTAPPNALATGEGLIVLPPGESTTSVWGVRLLDA
jgi:aldose 1-epimerase